MLSLAGAGTATEGQRLRQSVLKSLTLPAGTGTAASSITTTVTAVQDKIDEPDETILIDAKRGIGGNGPGGGLATDHHRRPMTTPPRC